MISISDELPTPNDRKFTLFAQSKSGRRHSINLLVVCVGALLDCSLYTALEGKVSGRPFPLTVLFTVLSLKAFNFRVEMWVGSFLDFGDTMS